MNIEKLPSNITRKNTKSIYMSDFSLYYLEQIGKKIGNKDESIGSILDKLILSQKDFKQEINNFFEGSKL